MYARVTLLEVDTVRVDLDDAVAMYERDILPAVRELPGYRGVYVLTTPEGKGAIISFWETEEQASTNSGGWYETTIGQYSVLFRSPAGRDRYEVRLADLPAPVS